MRLCSDLAQECGTSHRGTAVSEHFPLTSLNGERSFIHFAHVFNAFTKFIWPSSLAYHRVQITQCRSSATPSRFLAPHGTRGKTTGLKDSKETFVSEELRFWRQRIEHRDVWTQEQGAAGSLGLFPGRGTAEKTAEGMHEVPRLAFCWRSEVRQDLEFMPLCNSVRPNAQTRFKQRGAS